jgi:hypothetical protein
VLRGDVEICIFNCNIGFFCEIYLNFIIFRRLKFF